MRRLWLVSLTTVGILVVGQVWGQDSVWQLGGQGGNAWSDWADLTVMANDSSVPGALQPWELKPDQNLVSLLYKQIRWSRWQNPLDPFWVDGMPRLWRSYQNSARQTIFMPIDPYIDGDPNTFHWYVQFGPGGDKVSRDFYTIDVGARVPLERFVLQEPPRRWWISMGNPLPTTFHGRESYQALLPTPRS